MISSSIKKLFLATFLSVSSYSLAGSFYDIKMKDFRGKELDFSKFKGKSVLLVNIASGCGYTPQLGDMASLHEKYKDKGFLIVAVPSNSFNQEKLDSVKVGEFCELKYKSKYLVTEKSEVIGDKKIELFQFLVANAPSDKGKDVSWNFNKFLVSKNGTVLARFPSDVSPTSKEITEWIEKSLK
jgi:glutathione peroxidase